MKKAITLHMLHDPGHGWLSVPNDLVREVDRANGVATRISTYSYISDSRSFFEEDRDADLFFRAAMDAGFQIKIGAPQFAQRSASCRRCASFTSDRARLEIRPGGRYFCENINGGSFVRLDGLPESNAGHKYVVTVEGTSAPRYGVKPSEFHDVIRSEAYGKAFLLRREIDNALISKSIEASPFGVDLLSQVSHAGRLHLRDGEPCNDQDAHAFVMKIMQWAKGCEIGRAEPEFCTQIASNIAMNALQAAIYNQARGDESLVKQSQSLTTDHAKAQFLASLNLRVPIPPGHTLDLDSPIVPNSTGRLLFVTQSADMAGQPLFFVRSLEGARYSAQSACSDLVAEAPTRASAAAALYRRLAHDVLESPKTYADKPLSAPASAQLAEQMRALAGEADDPKILAEVGGPTDGDDEAADFVMT